MPDDSIKIDIATKSASEHLKRHRRSPSTLKLGAAVGILILIFIAVLQGLRTGNQASRVAQTPDHKRAELKNNVAELKTEAVQEVVDTWVQKVVQDDGKALWVSPTAGQPIELSYVPSGTQLLLNVRPAELVSHSEGDKVIASLGPWGARAARNVEQYSGVKLQEISSLLVALHPQENGDLSYTLRLELIGPWTNKKIAQRLPNSTAINFLEHPCRALEDRVYFLPKGDSTRTLVVCATKDAADLLANGANPPPLARDLQRLVDGTDSDRFVTLLFPTKFFLTSGNTLLHGSAKPLVEVLQHVAGDDSTTVAISMHWDDNFFIELQSTVTLNRQPRRFLAALRDRLSQLPGELSDSISGMSIPPYCLDVLNRFPAMTEQLSNYTRVGSEQGVSVVRCYLPLPAGHNLLMAAELMLNCTQAEGPSGQLASLESPLQKIPKSVASALERRTTLSFPKETLQKALEMLSEDLGVAIELRGRDLQLEGITKNQSFEINLRDQKAAEILLAILERANPDRSAAGPKDPKQKLVYLIRERSGEQPGVIVVTTRAAATERGESLPVVFRSPGR